MPQIDRCLRSRHAWYHRLCSRIGRASVQAEMIQRTIEDMDLTLKADARSKTYSGGNKRKLSVALSMIANPKVCFLDEPRSGLRCLPLDELRKKSIHDRLGNLVYHCCFVTCLLVVLLFYQHGHGSQDAKGDVEVFILCESLGRSCDRADNSLDGGG